MIKGTRSACFTSKYASPESITSRLPFLNWSGNSSVLEAFSQTCVLSGSNRYLYSDRSVLVFFRLAIKGFPATVDGFHHTQTIPVDTSNNRIPTPIAILRLAGRFGAVIWETQAFSVSTR